MPIIRKSPLGGLINNALCNSSCIFATVSILCILTMPRQAVCGRNYAELYVPIEIGTRSLIAQGSGMVVGASDSIIYVITAWHVVNVDTSQVYGWLSETESDRLKGSLKDKDLKNDLALIEFQHSRRAKSIPYIYTPDPALSDGGLVKVFGPQGDNKRAWVEGKLNLSATGKLEVAHRGAFKGASGGPILSSDALLGIVDSCLENEAFLGKPIDIVDRFLRNSIEPHDIRLSRTIEDKPSFRKALYLSSPLTICLAVSGYYFLEQRSRRDKYDADIESQTKFDRYEESWDRMNYWAKVSGYLAVPTAMYWLYYGYRAREYRDFVTERVPRSVAVLPWLRESAYGIAVAGRF